jgi:hypothetical protein
VMTDPSDKQYEHGEYAKHCLHTLRMMPNLEARELQRRIAFEWLKFADALLSEPLEARRGNTALGTS